MSRISKCHSAESNDEESLPLCDKTQYSLLLSSLSRTLRKQTRLTAMLPDLEYSLELENYGQGTENGEEYPVLLTTCIWAFDVPEHPCLSWMV